VKLSQLRDVVAVAETGSLRSAGRLLGIAQPAITRSIREIEHELGAILFERHAKGVRLTEIGRAFVKRAESVQAEIRRAQEEIDQLKGQLTGEVNLAVSTATAMCLLPKSLQNFRRKYPEAVLKISESFFAPIERELQSGQIDFYVGPFERDSTAKSFVVEELFSNVRRIVARRGHPLAGAKSYAELADAYWIRPAVAERITEGDFDDSFAEARLQKPRIVLQSRSALITMITVANSDLLTVLPQQWLDFPLTAPLVVALDVPAFRAAPICIVRRQDMPLTPLAEHLCDLLRRAGTQYAFDMQASLSGDLG
jgi:LysR family transcriptional regulator, regulator of abg operon